MLIRLPIADLKFCLGIAFSATSSNKNRPILNNVLLSLKRIYSRNDDPKHTAQLIATDGDITVCCDLRHVTVQGEGEECVLLPPVLGSIINELPQVTDVELSVDAYTNRSEISRRVTVSSGMGRFRLQTADPTEFPPSSVSEELGYDVSVDGTLLQRAIQRVLPAVDPEATRYALGSIRLELGWGSDELAVIATDGRRLGYNRVKITEHHEVEDAGQFEERWKNVLLPANAAKVLAKIAKDSPTVKLRADSSTLTAAGLGLSIQCRLTSGRFPRWREVIPQSSQVIELPAGAFHKSIKAAAATVDKDSDGAKLVFSNNSEGGNVTISIESEEGNATVDCPLPHNVEAFETMLRAQYISQALAAMPADDMVEMHVPETDGGPVVLRNLASDFTAVIMPMAAQDEVETDDKKKGKKS